MTEEKNQKLTISRGSDEPYYLHWITHEQAEIIRHILEGDQYEKSEEEEEP